MSSLLHCKSIIKSYGSRRVLDNLSLSIDPGERLALMGPSGSGKSTLLNCLGGVDRFDSGSIRIGDFYLESAKAHDLCRLRREILGSVFQFFHLLPTLSVRENIAFPLLLNGAKVSEAMARADDLILKVGLTSHADAGAEELSGGEMQRCAIARALAPRPRLLLADEPTGNLDSTAGEQILDLLEAVTKEEGMSLVMVTHSDAATRICHRVVHLLDGRIEEAVSA